ncbi:uncharacterized protein At1g51745-like [Telopea speciosissima]|uniref:uncharacterized protein At1g51745-like n=1 Tax=Telopea speciosissima TaxID=54955 RepID=UPI001CC737B2|nr:uncharacterized protein At1g51745-like [Telopea speciosissima]
MRDVEIEMGISDGLEGSDGVDCSVGSIVWVRRRNGSWWPGRILGPNELSASHLMSPRSGTPVKLLGREDASVDWYNLEKSKRVKAFRCGEFDDCIERAESSQGIPIKKREKYARREDAILHALELEKEQQKLGVVSNSTSSQMPGKNTSQMGNDHSKCGNLKLQDENVGDPIHVQKVKQGKQKSLEDNSEAIPRMRGLQDFGLRIASSKRKLSASTAPEGSRKFLVVDHMDILPNGGRSVGNANHISSSKNSLATKRKRSQGGMPEESIVKRRDRRRPLVQVLQSSAKLPVSHSFQSNDNAVSTLMHGEKEHTGVICRAKRSKCVYFPTDSNGMDHTEPPPDQMQISQTQFGIDNCHLPPGSLTKGSASDESMEDVESDYSGRDNLEPVIEEETTVFSGATTEMQPIEPSSGRYVSTDGFRVQGQSESMSTEELDQTATVAADGGVSKWQQKGKRNIRNLTKRPVEAVDGKFSNGSICEPYLEGRENDLNQRASGPGFYPGGEDLNYVYDEGDLIEKDAMRDQVSGFGNRRYPFVKSASKDWNRITDAVNSEEDPVWGTDGLSQSILRGYWENRSEYFDPIYGGHRLGNGMESTLVDVDIKVQASYQGEHVPLVSLMSRLNGKAIVGHPIQIEALEDGATDKLFSTHGGFDVENRFNDGSTGLPPVWRTARRTAMHRVPRPQLSSALEGDETADLHPYADLDSKPLYRKPYPGNLSHKARLMKKSLSQIRRPSITEKKFPKKLLKKVSISSQKTRTLSSIAIDQKSNGKTGNPKLANKSNMEGLIKPVETGLTTVTCIPVKLVFSRLLEAVGRPPRPAYHGVLKGDTERKPS